ncbi:MAG: hypothetical protein KBG43_00950, partial [Paludibacteraceae bacterium]|nr:hypothetical protein [Paludibacteraceae bacterium]
FSMNYPLSKKISVSSSNNARLYWTLRALARAGYSVENEATTQIQITENGWEMESISFSTIEDLLAALTH